MLVLTAHADVNWPPAYWKSAFCAFQNSLSRALQNPKWTSKSDFTAVLQPAPLILQQNSVSNNNKKNISDIVQSSHSV